MILAVAHQCLAKQYPPSQNLEVIMANLRRPMWMQRTYSVGRDYSGHVFYRTGVKGVVTDSGRKIGWSETDSESHAVYMVLADGRWYPTRHNIQLTILRLDTFDTVKLSNS